MPRIPDPAPGAVFKHPDLSLAAKGALAVILTRPSGARVSPEYLSSSSGDPMTVVSKAVQELARTGLVGTAKAGRAGGGVMARGWLSSAPSPWSPTRAWSAAGPTSWPAIARST